MAFSCNTRWIESLCPPEGLALSTLHRGRSSSLSPLSWSSSSISDDDRWGCAANRDSRPSKPTHISMIFGEEFFASANSSTLVTPKKLHSMDSKEAAMTANVLAKKRTSLNHTCISTTSSQSSFTVLFFDERWTAGNTNSFIDISPILPRRKVHSQDVKQVIVLHMPLSLDAGKMAQAA